MRLVVPLPIGDPVESARQTPEQCVDRPRDEPTEPSREQAERERSLAPAGRGPPDQPHRARHCSSTLIGFHVDLANDGQEAYEHWLTGRYALVLTDLNMPRLDGYELARAIRARERETGSRAHADHRAQRQRDAGRAEEVPGRRDGRLRGQADDDPRARRPAARAGSPTSNGPATDQSSGAARGRHTDAAAVRRRATSLTQQRSTS